MAGLDVFIGDASTPALRMTEGLWWYLDALGFPQFASETGIAIPFDAPTAFDAEFLLAFFLSLEPVVGDLRNSTAEYVTEVGLDDTQSQITAFQTPRKDAVRDIDALMTAANDAYNDGACLKFKPAG